MPMSVPVDPLSSLTRLERRILRVRKQRGNAPFVVGVTIVSVVLSIAITALLLLSTGFRGSQAVVGLAIAALVPAIVAPIVAGLLGRLLGAIDKASTELRYLSRTDALTDVLNRRAFAEDVQALISTRSDEVLVAAMIDVDEFKAVNDCHGHASGDRVLQTLAGRLSETLGGTRVIGRLGGDEFAGVVLVDTAQGAEALISRIRRACDLGDMIPGLRASVGSVITDERRSLDDVLIEADHALYQAKRERASAPVPQLLVPGRQMVERDGGGGRNVERVDAI